MTRTMLIWSLGSAALMMLLAVNSQGKAADSVLDFQAKDIDGKPVDLSEYKGEVLLIVNTASRCGYTPQYEGMQAIYSKYADQGFKVLAFPANEFGAQEPGTDAQIKEFCSSNFDVSFPLFSKVIVKGQGIHPLFAYLTSEEANSDSAGDIRWNFTKFLVDHEGKVIARFEPGVAPESPELTGAIEKALAAKK